MVMASCQAVADFLSGLPSRDPHNFQKWSSEGPKQNVTRKPSSYVPTKDIPSQQGWQKRLYENSEKKLQEDRSDVSDMFGGPLEDGSVQISSAPRAGHSGTQA